MDFADFGRYLTQQRELRGMSREDVTRATKIPATVIEALETGHVERLPARVFVLNYVRAYAQVIGLSPDEAVLRFEEVDNTLQTAPPPAALERERRKKALVRLGLSLAAVVLGIYVLLAATSQAPWPWAEQSAPEEQTDVSGPANSRQKPPPAFRAVSPASPLPAVAGSDADAGVAPPSAAGEAFGAPAAQVGRDADAGAAPPFPASASSSAAREHEASGAAPPPAARTDRNVGAGAGGAAAATERAGAPAPPAREADGGTVEAR